MKKIPLIINTFVITVITLLTPMSSIATTLQLSQHKPLQLAALKNLKLNFNTQPIVPRPPKIDAAAYILIDVNSGKVLAQNNPDKRRSPASLTKLMTLYIISSALEQGQIKMKDQVRISKAAWKTGGSRMFVKVGETVPVHELLKGIIVASGNDACVAMAEHLAGSEESFSDLMNQQAKLLGMKNSHFTDSTGMPHPKHYVTARDMSVLARALIRDYPEDYKWYKQKWFTHNGIRQPNRNRLLWRDSSVDGLKTGHTQEAGYCLVASAQKTQMRLLSVVLGAPSPRARAEDSRRLLTFGFRFYETQRLYKANQAISTPRVWMGDNATVPVGVTEDLFLTIPRGQFKNLSASIELDDQLKAPITKGQQLGKLNIMLHEKLILSKPILALNDNPRGGIFTRMRDKIHLKIKGWLGSRDKKEATPAAPKAKK